MKPQRILLLSFIVAGWALGPCIAAEPPAKESDMNTITLKPADADNSPAIVKALEELRAKGGGKLVLEPGRYVCRGGKAHPDGRTHEPSVHVGKLKDVTIDGQGATLIGKDIARLFSIFDSENITIRNLTIDWDPLPHTSGTVVAVQADTHSFDIKPQIPADSPDGRIVQGILAYNSKRHRLADDGWEIYQTQGERDADLTKRTPEGHLRIFQGRVVRLPEVGWEVVVRHQVYAYDAFVFTNCAKVLLEDVTVHAVPGMAVIGWGSRDLTIRRIKVVPSGEGWMSATADAMHFGACRGTITVEESEFAGMGDDAINIHGMYGMATARVDDHTLAIARARWHPYYDKKRSIWDAPAPGDQLEYGGGDEPLLAQGQLVVVEAQQDTKQERTIVKFKDALPAGVGENTVLWNLSTSPAVRITKCYVHSNRARGMLLQTRDVVLDGCTFEDISGAGLQICTDAQDWWESLGSRDVTVKNCIFRRCNFGVARRAAALDLFSDLAKGRQSAAGVHQRIKILDCTFEENSGAAINIGSAIDVEIRGNKIAHGSTPVVIIMNSRNVTASGNTGLPEKNGVAIKGSSDQVTIK
jgi:hypothetical protein